MKIISGKHKNRVIPINKKADYRPTTSKFREALFSILSSGVFADEDPVSGADILEIFSGSGILSFEALSRGANSSTLIDKNNDYLEKALEFAAKIGELDNLDIICTDALRIRQASRQYDIVFLDPPYHKKLGNKLIPLLIEFNWIKENGIIAIEVEKRETIAEQNNLELIKEKIYGKNKLLIYRYRRSI